MNVSKHTYFLTLLLLLVSTTVFAQNEREKLETQKTKLQEKIKETERILSQTSNQKQSSLGRLKALNNQIQTRTSLILAIRNEVSLLDEDMAENQDIIDAMDNDLTNLKEEYAQMVYSAYKSNQGFSELTFLFSSSSFNQLYRRMQYMKQYSKARKKQGEQIKIVQDDLKDQIAEIDTQRQSKQGLLDEELSENKELENLQGEQKNLVTRLTRQEAKIKQDLNKQRKAEKELTGRIEDIIEAERRAAALASVDMSNINEAFEKQQGKLPWPVSNGFISSKFGVHRHPTLKRVTQNNPGIDIQTPAEAEVRAIFPGKVLGIVSVEGMGNSIIIQHGNYFSVYSRLKTVNVKKGDDVASSQMLGKVLTDSQNVSELKFRIHNQKGSINPELWLAKKN